LESQDNEVTVGNKVERFEFPESYSTSGGLVKGEVRPMLTAVVQPAFRSCGTSDGSPVSSHLIAVIASDA